MFILYLRESIMENTNNLTSYTNLTCGKWELTQEENYVQEMHGWLVEGWFSVIVGLLGLVLNIITAYILSRNEFKNIFFNKLLICLAIFDILFLLNGLYKTLRINIMKTDICSLQDHISFLFLYPFRQIVMLCSIYMTIVLALERYLALNKPIKYHYRSKHFGARKSSGGKRILNYILPVIIFAVIYCIPLFFVFTIKTFPTEKTQTSITPSSDNTSMDLMLHENITLHCVQPTKLRESKVFILWYVNAGNFVVTGVLPFITLAFLNCKIYLFIQSAFKDRRITDVSRQVSNERLTRVKRLKAVEIRQAVVLLAVVIAFLVCNILRIILDMEETISYEDRVQTEKHAASVGKMCTGVQFWAMITADISHFLLQVNPSANFFIYCILKKHFRSALKEKLIESATFIKRAIGIM